jgi:hypothetical protein
MSIDEPSRPPSPLTIQERLDAVELQCRWADAVDRRQWSAVLSCFTDDASTDLPRTGRNSDIRTMLDSAKRVIERLEVTQHHLSNHLVDRTAEGLIVQCYVLAQHVRVLDDQSVIYTFGGRYTDHMVRTSGSLRIRHRQLEVIWSSGDPAILHP